MNFNDDKQIKSIKKRKKSKKRIKCSTDLEKIEK